MTKTPDLSDQSNSSDQSNQPNRPVKIVIFPVIKPQTIMSKYIPIEMVKEYRGKICSHSDTYFAKRNGTLYTGKICHPYTGEPTESQVAVRTKFKTAQAAARAALADPEQCATLFTAFKNQKRYKTLWGYTFAQEYTNL